MVFMKPIKEFCVSVPFRFTFTIGSPGEAESATDEAGLVALRVARVEVLTLGAVVPGRIHAHS